MIKTMFIERLKNDLKEELKVAMHECLIEYVDGDVDVKAFSKNTSKKIDVILDSYGQRLKALANES